MRVSCGGSIGGKLVMLRARVVLMLRLGADKLMQLGRYGGQSKQQHANREERGESGLEWIEAAHRRVYGLHCSKSVKGRLTKGRYNR